jgi:hypothetical protein
MQLRGQMNGCHNSVVYKIISNLLYVGDCALRDGNIVPVNYICLQFICLGFLMYLVGQK